ncbi:methylhydantoinase [Kineosporia sp. NBRC 101677]|uniref:hydantoinase B/oxoprolinase family protein n=3 Tax=Kineosporia TaxID=49184 RepID=UPI0024A4DB11|nr:hydantoinase B/oxoprolinase family protein [Kineosporia sp. NBRC 101677]GLY15103.1 methylhydantoinase [Kineosporia sp. NBRC 101677]
MNKNPVPAVPTVPTLPGTDLYCTSPGGYTERYWNPVDLDPITLSVIGGALDATAKEMAQVLYRMSYSTLIRESEDLGAGLFDVVGREFCESDSTPMHIGSLPGYIRGINRKLEGTYRPGDVILHNDPYHGAAHSPDYGVLIPIFHEGRHVAFAAATGHLSDVGGASPGLSVDAIDVFAEGKILDAVRLERAGVRNEDLWEHVLGNVRAPSQNAGDIEAMISCCRLGVRRWEELVGRYGFDTVMSAAEAWMDHSESKLRAAISRVPDGVYRAPEGFLDDDGKNRGVPVRIATTVEVAGDEIIVDLTGSNAAVDTAINAPLEGSVLPTVNFAVRTLLLDEAITGEPVPQNDGIFRAVKVRVPVGTIYNPSFPHACSSRFPVINRIPDQVNLALAEVLPDNVTGGNSASLQALSYSGYDPATGEYWIYVEVAEGSYGGRSGKDGLDSVDNLMSNTRNTPIEEVELRLPMRSHGYGLRSEPAARGQWRGGLGTRRVWQFLAPVIVSASGDFRTDPPRGIFGGEDGRRGRILLDAGTAAERELNSKFAGLSLAANTVLTIEVPNGAGYGDPALRSETACHNDVFDGFAAREPAPTDVLRTP